MLDVARAQGAAIDWLQGDAAALPLADEAFDLVLCQQGLQFFPRRGAALAEMHRVLTPGGRLALSVMRPPRTTRAGARWRTPSARHAGPEAGAMMRAPFPDWDAAELRALVTSAGFHDVRACGSWWRARAIRRRRSSCAGRRLPRRSPDP